MSERVRLTLDLSSRLNAEVERLALLRCTTKADVLRFSVELLSVADRAQEGGWHIAAWNDDHSKEQEFIGL